MVKARSERPPEDRPMRQDKASGRASRPRGARQVGELVAALVDPVLARKAGMNMSLITAWPEIAGARLAGSTRPDRLVWPARRYEDEPFQPATLIVACEGAFVLRLQHESGELLQRVNAAFGYHAVGRLKIVQQPVHQAAPSRKPAMGPLREADRQAIRQAVARIDSERLKLALERYGECVIGRNRGRKD